MDLGRAEVATVVSPAHAPVIAVAADEPTPFVTHRVCSGNDCWLQKSPVEARDGGDPYLPPGSELMLTPSGHYLVGINAVGQEEEASVLTFEIHGEADAVEPIQMRTEVFPNGQLLPRHLVASMRGSDTDWLIARDADGALMRYAPNQASGQLLALDIEDLGVAAVGERHLVGRQIHSGGEETLYLIVVDGEGNAHEQATPLLRGETFSRVTLTPRDDMVIATAGEGTDAETFVFDVASGKLLDRFAGAAISGRAAGEELPGLRAVSPDGSALAYRTPGGAVAMRGLDTQGSCLVRSAGRTPHSVAGFSADGVLYMEANAGGGDSQIYAFDPPTRRLTTLGDPTRGMKLVAVPGREVRDADDVDGEVVAHWALAVSQGRYQAVLEDGAAEALPLDDEVTILPRDDAAVWLLDTSDVQATIGTSKRMLRVRRLAPRLGLTQRSLQYDVNAQTVPELRDSITGRFEFEISKSSGRACIATGTPGSWGWGCGRSSSSLLFEFSPGDREHTADPGEVPLPQQEEPDPPPSPTGDAP